VNYSIFLFLSFSLLACHKTETLNYSIENKTDKTIQMDFYIDGTVALSKTQEGEGVIHSFSISDFRGNVLPRHELRNYDSIITLFDETKKHVFSFYHDNGTTASVDSNIYFIDAYEQLNTEDYLFCFDENYYNSADSIFNNE